MVAPFDEDSFIDVNRTALALLLQQFRQQRHECSTQPSVYGSSSGQAGSPTRCDEAPLHNLLLGPGFLVLLTMALLGNCLNLLVYQSDQRVRFHTAIRMLCTKLLMNTLMMCCLLPQALRVVGLWSEGSPGDLVYWRYWPYQVYFVNVFGFCAMWLTVMMTAECYLHVFFPSQSKQLCCRRNLGKSYCLITAVALLLALIYPLNRTVLLRKHCDRVVVSIVASQSPLMSVFERLHTIMNLTLAILLPLCLLVFMTGGIVWRLRLKPWRLRKRRSDISASQLPSSSQKTLLANGGNLSVDGKSCNGWRGSYASLFRLNSTQSGATAASGGGPKSPLSPTSTVSARTKETFRREKRGVTRITLITTLLQLITEAPSVPVLIYASVFGPHQLASGSMCTWQTLSHFLGLCNASLSFFVYITFSCRFRNSMLKNARAVGSKFLPSIISPPTPVTGRAVSERGLYSRSALPSAGVGTPARGGTKISMSASMPDIAKQVAEVAATDDDNVDDESGEDGKAVVRSQVASFSSFTLTVPYHQTPTSNCRPVDSVVKARLSINSDSAEDAFL